MGSVILTVFTGGTIGSRISDGCISVNTSEKYHILDLYRRTSDNSDVCFHTADPYTILSENLNGSCLGLLGQFVDDALDSHDYDGIIITHGSDTLQYSAAMLDLYLDNPRIPVMLVASNLVPDDPSANGPANFKAAVDFITGVCTPGVFVPYRNRDGVTYIHRGSLMLPHIPYSDDFHSIYDGYFGIMSDIGVFTPSQSFHPQTAGLADIKSLPGSGMLKLPSSDESGILRIHPYPGITYPVLSGERLPRAVLLDTYHCGTINCHTDDAERFFARAYDLGIPVFLTGAYGGPHYESTSVYETLHIQVLPPMSPVCTYMYLWMSL